MKQLLLIVALLSLNLTNSLAEMDGQAIIDRVVDRKGAQTEQVQVTMKLQNSAGAPREADRTFRIQAIYAQNNDFKTLLTFLLPAGIKNTKILTLKEGDTTGQWIYLPAAKRVSRINSDDDVEGVLDSDLAFSDLKAESNEEYNYSLNSGSLEEYSSRICGEPAYSVTAISKAGKGSSYSKRVLSISKEKFVVCGAVVYDKKGIAIKNIKNEGFRNMHGLWRPSQTTITSSKDGKQVLSKTILLYADWKLKVRLDPGIFSVNNLER